MELRQLRHFLEVVKHASFGGAANAVGLSQPAVSKSIKNLEDSLRVALVERTPSGVFPTPYGKVLLDYAVMIDNQVSRVTDEIAALRGSARGIVRVGAGPSLTRYLMPQIIERFRRRLPDVDIVLVERLKDELFVALRRGDIDLVVGTIREEDRLPEFNLDIILKDEIDIVASVTHPLAGKPDVTLKDLVAFGWVLPSATEPERQYLNRRFSEAGLPLPKIKVQTSSIGFVAEYLPGTTLLCYSSRHFSGLVSRSDIVPLMVDLKGWTRPIGISTRSEAVMLPAVRVFIEELKKAGTRLSACFDDELAAARANANASAHRVAAVA